ncbi:class F sortase [Phytoactinopolyspora mesophila]|uniref:Sortase n=1 Tax=Phytoactinopolyspora mesophila TaxID=2650750 RepID=A0A7K3M7C0_9ACTN|nr:class F sortase [Phytoactinopolyspora mesophila]NDL59164.1 sortase [Phytoactinopolyspora mesophila]
MIRTKSSQATAHRPTRLVGGALAIMLLGLVGLLLVACGSQSGLSSPDVVAVDRPQVQQPTATPTSTPAGADETSPHAAEPIAVQVPAANIDTSLIPVGLQDDGAMELPDPGLGAWYELGPRPGEPGAAVLVGHVDSVAGPDVFFGLNTLTAGDVVHVDDEDGARHTFTVTEVELVDKEALPYERIWMDTSEPVLRLITCGGPYNRAAGGYQENVVVYAEAS